MSDLHFICSMKQIGFHRPLHHLRSRVAVRSELPASWMASWNGSPWGRCKSGQPLSWWGGARPSFSHEGPSSQLMCKPLYFEVLSQAFRGRGQNQLNSWGALLHYCAFLDVGPGGWRRMSWMTSQKRPLASLGSKLICGTQPCCMLASC